mmetsp:Transcript_10212/g.12391  ORF Transcript_10212/g.12391 Transcript_10212/m.12391 type:complete len:247 (-) Transcript_10212:129-869(-)
MAVSQPIIYFPFLSWLLLQSVSSVSDPGIIVINAGRSEFKGVEGALTRNDALTLKAFIETKCNSENILRYAEVGSYLGLSANIVADTCPQSLIFCHDLFPMEESLPEASAPPPEPINMLLRFWNGIKNNNIENIIIPMRGKSEITLQIHDNESLDFGFIDGDHSYDGALIDLKLMWSKLKIGGLLLIHDAVILEDGTNHYVRQAVIKFSDEVNTKFYDIEGTWGLVIMTKGGMNEEVKNNAAFKWN